MSLENYALACNGLLSELTGSLTREDIDMLRADCAAVGWGKWCRWAGKNLSTICDYVQSTPSQRLRKKAWQDPPTRRALVLAAIQCVYRAKYLLDGLSEHNIVPGKSYRYIAALAGFVYLEIFSKDVPRWPFSGKDPFSD